VGFALLAIGSLEAMIVVRRVLRRPPTMAAPLERLRHRAA
jgi:hypothetical protein